MRNDIISITEEWLRTAVEQLNKHVFDGDLELESHEYQIYYGRVRGKKGAETVQPSDNEDITLDDFFPTTIGIDYQIGDLDKLMAVLAFECIKAFRGVTKGKVFKKTCERYYFDAPYTEPNPSPYLRDLLHDALEGTIKQVGPFPGKAIKFPVKEKKEKKPTKVAFFCPECGYELNTSVKTFEKYNKGCPTCICGCKMGIDMEDENTETEETANSTN